MTDKTPPSSDSTSQTPPSSDTASQTPPSSNTGSQTPPSSGSAGQTPPSSKTASQVPPSPSTANKTSPSSKTASQTPPSPNTANPTAAEISSLFDDIETLIGELDKKFAPGSTQRKAVDCLQGVYSAAKAPLVLPTDELKEEDWKKKGREERSRLFMEFLALKRSVVAVGCPDIRAGQWTFGALLATFVLAIGLYVGLHVGLRTPVSSAATSAVNTSPQGQATADHGKASAGQAQGTATGTADPPATPGNNDERRNLEIEERIAMVKYDLAVTPLKWPKIIDDTRTLSNSILVQEVSFHTTKELGVLTAAADQKNEAAAKAALADVEASVDQDLADPVRTYLWTRGALKWAEIAFWALFGVLVGLLYYVSSRLKQGVFDEQDISTMVTEVVAAPVVACIVFFLFNETGITQIASPAGASMLVVLGVAFILGYAIRRTITLLDNIKKRILPTP